MRCFSIIFNLKYSIFNLDVSSALAMQGRVVAWKGGFISMLPRPVSIQPAERLKITIFLQILS